MNQNQIIISNGILELYQTYDSEITIPEGVHTIAEGALKGNAGLRRVVLPSTLKTICASAFKGCRQLHDIQFPEGLEEVGDYAFNRCHNLEELIFPKTMTKIGAFAFLYCDNLKKVVMEGPEHLSKAVFSHCWMLEDVALNRNVDDSNFSQEVFEGCIRLSRITLSGDVFEIKNLVAAMDSHSDFPQVIRSLAKSVYHLITIEDGGVLKSFNINLKSVLLPDGIVTIAKRCFFNKKGIVSISLPKSVKEIKANAFLNCLSLEEISFEDDDVELDSQAFRGCNNLKKVHLRGETFLLEDDPQNPLVGAIRDQVLGDFNISGKILMKYTGNEEQIRIPNGVEIIGERCFFGNEQLKTVLCPDGLIEIREQAFLGCVTLQNIVLPETLKRIECEAFAECKKLLKCNIPNTLEFIGEYAFRRCFTLPPFEPWPENAEINPYAFYRAKNFAEISSKLQQSELTAATPDYDIQPYSFSGNGDVTILKLSNIKRIGKYSYASCQNLEEIIIDAPECVIENNAFATCPNLKKIHLNVKELGKGVFAYCRELKEVFISGVSVLPAECFAGCYSLSGFEAKEITTMEARCFDECIHLNSFDFQGIKKIGERAFERCDSLTSVKLGAVECGYHAFADCASLQTVEFIDETILKSGAFIGCTQIKDVIYNGLQYNFSKFSDSINHVGNPYPYAVRELIASVYSCFEIADHQTITAYHQDATRITIPEDVEEIGQDVFANHVRLSEINIPPSVKIFGPRAFFMTAWIEHQRKLSGMVIVNNVLLDGAVCKGKVVIPSGVRRLGSWCFAGNIDITEVEFPPYHIGVDNLAFRNCHNLKKIIDRDRNEYHFNHVSDLSTANYPELIKMIFSECINCFKLDENQNLIESTGNITRLTFPEGIRSIGDGVYQDCHLLETISLSSETEKIGKSAFENSKWLRTVTNSKSVTSIGAMAFSGCISLQSIDLSDNLTELGKRCFEHCCNLQEIYLGCLETIPERAFFRCKSLKKVVIPKSVRVIEAEAFAFCEALEEVVLSKDTEVADGAFEYCEEVRITHSPQ